jgi:hypothetical protein
MKTRIIFDRDEYSERELTAYAFDRKTFVYCGHRQVRGERFGNGDTVYTLRPFETMEEPPILEDGEVAVFLERPRTWVTVEDHRGETWFDRQGNPQLIGRVGNPAEFGEGLRKEPGHFDP